MLKIKVCRSCGWTNTKLRRELERLQSTYEDEIRVLRKDCMDHCKKDPVVCVAKTVLAPARPKRLRRLVETLLGAG